MKILFYDDTINGNATAQVMFQLLEALNGQMSLAHAVVIETEEYELGETIRRLLKAMGQDHTLIPETSLKMERALEAVRDVADQVAEKDATRELLDPAWGPEAPVKLLDLTAAQAEEIADLVEEQPEGTLPPHLAVLEQRLEESLAPLRGVPEADLFQTLRETKPDIEQRAKGKRGGRKPHSEAAVAEKARRPYGAGKTYDPIRCPYCQEWFTPTRSTQVICGKPDCKKAYKNDAQKRRRLALAGSAREEPTNADLEEVQAFEAELAQDLAADPADSIAVELPEEEPVEAEAAPALRGATWLIEDGRDKGTRLTPNQLRHKLLDGNMRPGQHLRHNRSGEHVVVKGQPYPAQKLQRLYGDGAPAYVLPAEL